MTFLFDSPYSPPSNPHAHNTIRTMIKLDTYLNRTHHHLQLPFESLAYIALLMLLFQDSSVQALHPYGRKNNGAQALPFSIDRKSTRLNSSHVSISYALFCL